MCWINDVFKNVVLCVIVLPATKSMDKEEAVYLLATALYMADDQGMYVLLDKALPPSIEAVIKQHALSLLNPSMRSKAYIKVVPRPPHLQPFTPNPNILRVDLREVSLRKHFMSTMWNDIKQFWDNKILRKGNNKKKKTKPSETQRHTVPILKSNVMDNVTDTGDGNGTFVTESTDGAQTSVTTTDTLDETIAHVSNSGVEMVTVKPCAPAIKGVQWVKKEMSHIYDNTWLKNVGKTTDVAQKKEEKDEKRTGHYDYVPKDIYYSIEKKCVNWSNGCQLKSPSILEQPSSSFKFFPEFLLQPKKSLWDP